MTHSEASNGITLIALVVTIVVLLILAGITITAILSEEGILNTAKRAEKVQEEASIKEKIQVILADAKIKELVNNQSLFDYLDEEGYNPKDNGDGTITVTIDGYTTTINAESEKLETGLYDASNKLIASWEDLETMGLDITQDYTNTTYNTQGAMYYLLENNATLKEKGVKLIIPIITMEV